MKTFNQFRKQNISNKIPVAIVIHDKNYENINTKFHENYDPFVNTNAYRGDGWDYVEPGQEFADNSKYSEDEKKAIRRYTGRSFALNHILLAKHHFGEQVPDQVLQHSIKHLDSVANRPVPRPVTVYSGLGFDPRKLMDKDNKIHFPSYTSTSFDDGTAKSFANTINKEKHVLKLDLDTNNKGGAFGGYGDFEVHEFLLPRNSRVTIHHTEDGGLDYVNRRILIHHGTVEHDADPNEVERNPEHVRKFDQVAINNLFHTGNHGLSDENQKKLNQMGLYSDLNHYDFHTHPVAHHYNPDMPYNVQQ